MARLPNAATSDVQPAGPPANDYQDIRASPASFGALQGAAEQKFGSQGVQAADQGIGTVTAFQDRWNQIATDDAFNKFQTGVNQLTFGGGPVTDPTDPNSGKGLYQLKGADALRVGQGAGGTLDRITQLRDQLKAGLQNGAQQLEFDQASRRLVQYTSGEISRHLDAQGDAYATEMYRDGIKGAAQSAGLNYTDAGIMHNMQEGRVNATRGAQVRWGSAADQSVIQQATSESDNIVVRSAIQGALASDPYKGPAIASGILQKYGNFLDPGTREVLTRELKPAVDDATVNGQIMSITTGQPYAGAQPSSAISGAIRGQEGSGSASVSSAGAHGTYQVTPGFFQQYAKPGEDFNKDADRTIVAQRGIDALSQQYNGDASRVAVAYFSGPGNVAPPGSPTPWLMDKKDTNGVSTSQYVAGVQSRLPPTGPSGQLGANEARSAAIPSGYMTDIQMLGEAYKRTQGMDPRVAERIIDGVYKHISQKNALEDHADTHADKSLANFQRDNEAVLFGHTVNGEPISETDLGNMLIAQQITPAGYNAIKAVQTKQAEGTDDPMATAKMWGRVSDGNASKDDIYGAVIAKQISGKTANEMIKTQAERAKTQTNAVERGGFETLRAALNGKIIEAGGEGLKSIFPGEAAGHAAQLWSQAQGEWNDRVIFKKEDPQAVLADMLPRYQKAQPTDPSALPNPRFGAVTSTKDIAAVAQKTKDAFAAGQITQDVYNSEGALLNRYLTFYQHSEAASAAAAKAMEKPKATHWWQSSSTPAKTE